MATATMTMTRAASGWAPAPEPPPALSAPAWYAACTRSRHEKTVGELLAAKGIEHFLPLCRTVRRWRSRLAEVELPLFSGYVFVRISIEERLRVLTIPGLAYLVSAGGFAVEVPAGQLERLRARLADGVHAEPHPYLPIGGRVRVVRGALEGLEGVLVRKQGRARLIVSIEMILRSIVLDVNAADVEPLAPR